MNLEFLRRAGADLPREVVEYLEKTRTVPAQATYRRILKERRDNMREVVDFGRVLYVSSKGICQELIRYSGLSLPLRHWLPENLRILRSLLVELIMTLEIPVLAFQESHIYDIQRARCTRARLFRNQVSQTNCVWIHAGGEQMYGVLRGRIPAKHLELFITRNTH